MKKRKPRKLDERVTYTPQQTQRYKSQWLRYQKGLAMAEQHLVHKISEEIYRVPSTRSPIGYWEVTTKEDKTTVTGTWKGEKPSDGEIELKWQGKKPDTSILTTTWEGRKCIEKPSPADSPNWFEPLDLSGCYPRWGMWIAIPYKMVRYTNEYGAYDYTREVSSISEFLEKFRIFFPENNETDEEILIASEGSGFNSNFEYGTIFPGFGLLVEFNLDGTPSYGPSGHYYEVAYRVSRVGVDVQAPVYDGETIISSLKNTFQIVDEITVVKIDPPEIYSENCDLLDFNTNPPGEPPSCLRGSSPITWQCTYPLSEQEIGQIWEIIDKNGLIRAYSSPNYIYKSISPCPPPQPIDNRVLIQINGEEIIEGDEIDWICEYTIPREQFSPNWTITNPEGTITNDRNQSLTLTPCTPPEAGLQEIELTLINSVTSNNNGYTVEWGCDYEIDQEMFSPNWTITNPEGTITNDRDQSLALTPCTAPETGLQEIELIAIATEVVEGDGYKCTCPDFSKKEGAFSLPPYPSMSQERNWESSEAGAPTWSDGKRRCCHIVAVQQVRDEDIPVPEDFPLGEA